MTHWKSIVMVAGGVVLVGLTAWAFRATTEVQVESSRVTAGPITRRVVATGTVQPVNTVDVGAQVSGQVQSLAVDFNSMVRTGQVIARLDPSLYQAGLDQARAALLQAQAAYAQTQADLTGFRTAEDSARITLARAKALGASGVMTDADLDAAQIAMNEATADVRSGGARVDQARAGIDQARAAVDQATVNLDHTVIYSPIDGIVIDRSVDVGQTLAAAVQAPVLFRIATDLAHVQVQVSIDESDVGGLTEGEPATFEVESYPDESFHGIVTQLRLQPVAEQTTTATTVTTSTTSPTSSVVATVVNYTAIVDVENPDERLRPGMTAEVILGGLHRQSAIRIPNSALAFRPPPEILRALGEPERSGSDGATPSNSSDTKSRDVWEYDGKRFTPIAVHIGLSDDQWTELVSGAVHPGDALVTTAVLRRKSRM